MLIAIVASTPDGIIGLDQDMPWRLSSDLKRFKALTMGGTLLMGRKTFDSIGRALPGRRTWVLTRNPDWSAEGVTTVSDADAILAESRQRDVYVVGGGEIYRQWLPACDQLWWTRVWANLEGDTRVDLPLDQFRVVSQLSVPMTAKDEYPTDWLRMKRVNA
ncbi:dihydrofolate reductase [Neorhodopirellula pilleata]|uniref:Dihydrofolate reductase n=1 Tax=Neorhodopirellula pilleata TaxID=2714738 RepID=A0A5C6AXU6_9BACT|nr:dihydrofolate reductase [Neorhodopirellula pilleata]TWU03999.1 Dihydrofolate reductase type 3 [Neorhodopirellula pilleata]